MGAFRITIGFMRVKGSFVRDAVTKKFVESFKLSVPPSFVQDARNAANVPAISTEVFIQSPNNLSACATKRLSMNCLRLRLIVDCGVPTGDF